MSRLDRTIGALLPTVVVGAGASAGPAFSDTSAPTESTTTEPTTTEVAAPTTTTTTETEPSAAEPAVPDEPAEGRVDLTITVTFDKSSYVADEAIGARARVTNKGTAAATDVEVVSTGAVDSHHWQGFGFGVTVEPGQAVEGTLRAILNSRVDLLTLDATALCLPKMSSVQVRRRGGTH